LVQEPPGDFGVGVSVGVAVLTAPQVFVLGSQLFVAQSVSFLHSLPWPPGVVQTPNEPKMSHRWPAGHPAVMQQVLLMQNPD
jgi:hypothetical protein